MRFLGIVLCVLWRENWIPDVCNFVFDDMYKNTQFYKHNKVVMEVTGADEAKLLQCVAKFQ